MAGAGRTCQEPAREWKLVRKLARGRFDAAVILTSFRQSAWPAALVAMLAGIPLRLGASREQDLNGLMGNAGAPPDELHQAERNLLLLESFGLRIRDRSLAIHITAEHRERPEALLGHRGFSLRDPFLLLAPRASAQARTARWERLAEAARLLAADCGWPVVVTGMARDRTHAAPLLRALGDAAVDVISAPPCRSSRRSSSTHGL